MRWELLVSVMTSCWSQTPHLNQQSARRGYVQEPGMASVSCSSCFKEYVNVTYACCCKWAFPLVNLEFSIWIRASLWVWSQFFSIQTQSTSTISPAGVKPSIPPPPSVLQFSDQPTHSELHSVDWLRRIKLLATRSIIGYALTWSGSECIDPSKCAHSNFCYKTMIKH